MGRKYDEGMSPEAAKRLVFAIAGGEIRDMQGNPMRDGVYVKPETGITYIISNVRDYEFYASDDRFPNSRIIPNGGTDLIAYRAFASQLRRLEDIPQTTPASEQR